MNVTPPSSSRLLRALPAMLVLVGMFFTPSCATVDSWVSAKPEAGVDTNAYIELMLALSKRFEVEPVPVGLTRQVFFDDALISSSTGLVRKQGHPVKLNNSQPVITQDTRGENKFGNWGIGLYLTVLTNKEGLFRCWYMYGKNNEVGYASSTNGIHWKKPILNLNFDNRVLYPAVGACVMEDPHETRRSHRFKMIYGGKDRGRGALRAVMFARSPDGISWTRVDDIVWMDDQGTDTGNSMMWDEELGMYRIFVRPGFAERRSRQLVRRSFDSGKVAFIKKLIFIPADTEPWVKIYDLDAPWGEIYSFFCQKYGSIYIGYIQMFTAGDFAGRGMTPTDRIEVDVNDFYITTSRDGLTWDFSWIKAKEPFIERGPAGSFDQNGVWPPSSELLTVNDKHMIYYCGRWPRHSRFTPGAIVDGVKIEAPIPRSSIGVAEIRRDGLIYREAQGEPAVLTTKSFELQGNSVEINCDAREGRLVAEVLDASGAPYPGYGAADADATSADDCHHILSWRGSKDLSSLHGQVIRLRFSTTGTVRLYAFQVLP